MQEISLTTDKLHPFIKLARKYNTSLDTEREYEWTPDRTVSYYELSYFISSNDAVIIINDDVHNVLPGEIRLCVPGDITRRKNPYTCYTVYFHFGKEDLKVNNEILDSIPRWIQPTEDMTNLFKEMVNMFCSSRKDAPVCMQYILLELISKLYTNTNKWNRLPKSISVCLDYINEHFREKLTLGDLGKLTSYSPLYIYRLFKQTLSISPHDYIIELRINHAKALLLSDKDYTASSLAELCGFSSESHFKTLFKKVTGTTVGSFKKTTKIR